jgi:hypothetical protein
MVYRYFALLAALTIFPVHAALIEYSFTALADGDTQDPIFGTESGGTITGGFLFDDAAPMIPDPPPPGSPLGTRYDMSNLLLWVTLGDQVLSARGDQLLIRNSVEPWQDDNWYLTTRPNDVGGYLVKQMRMNLYAWSPLTNEDLQVPNYAEWAPATTVFRCFCMTFTDGTQNSSIHSNVQSITPVSVPEPATLSLLAAGALGALAARRRRRAAEA